MEDVFSGWGNFGWLGVVLMPFVVAFITKCSWPAWSKFLIVIVLSMAIAAVTIWQTGVKWELSWEFMFMFAGAATAVYRALKQFFPSVIAWFESHGVSDPACPPDA